MNPVSSSTTKRKAVEGPDEESHMKKRKFEVIKGGREYGASTPDGNSFKISIVANGDATLPVDTGLVAGPERIAMAMSTPSKTTKSVEEMTPMERLTEVLYLALTAPTDKLANDAGKLADQFAFGLSDAEVEACKNAALSKSRVRGRRPCAKARRG
jgi:hypothetical protein